MQLAKNIFLKLMGIVNKVEMCLSEIVLAALIFVTIIGTLTRYFLGMPFTWMEEFQLACMLWVVFLAGSAAFYEKAHVAIEMVVDLFPEKLQRVIHVLIGIIVVIILVFLLFTSAEYLNVFIRSGRTTPILKLPYAIVYGIVPIACVLMILEYFHGSLDKKSIEDDEGGNVCLEIK